MKLIIHNKGEAPLHGYTHLGLSDARGDDKKIGQFGSGAKHGMLTALRAGHQIDIYSGLNHIKPVFEPMQHNPKHEELVLYINGSRTTTSMTRGFGELDWECNMDFALREFFSNAIDQGESVHSCFATSETVTPKAGITQIVLDLTGDVQNFISNLDEWYVNKPLNEPFKPHTSESGICYLKGVKVGKLNTGHPCLFNYNLKEAVLNESRTIDSDTLRGLASQLLNENFDRLQEIFRNIGKEYFETIGFNAYSVSYYSDHYARQLREAWISIHGDAYPVTRMEEKFFTSKKIPYVLVGSKWHDILTSSYVKLGYDKKAQQLEEKYIFSPPTPEMKAMLDRGWSVIESARLTLMKPKPSCGAFTQAMSEGCQTMGMFFKGTVWFNLDEPPSLQTCLEELVHYITNANDETRDFQDFALRLAARLAQKLEQTQN